MNDKEFDKLLRESMQKEFIVPQDLDRKTRQAMKQVNETKAYRFTGILITLSILLTGLGISLFWQFHPSLLYKVLVLMVCFSLFTLFLLLYIINYQTHVRKEIIV